MTKTDLFVTQGREVMISAGTIINVTSLADHRALVPGVPVPRIILNLLNWVTSVVLLDWLPTLPGRSRAIQRTCAVPARGIPGTLPTTDNMMIPW
jgi:hypothetical protein